MGAAFTALMLTTFSSLFSIATLAANAQIKSNAPQKISQARRQSLPNLQLSQQQINTINQIRSITSTQVQNVLTPQQRQYIQTNLQAGRNPQQVFASIRLTQQQQNQIGNIMKNSQALMLRVLTPAQKRALVQWQANRQGGRNNANRTIQDARRYITTLQRQNFEIWKQQQFHDSMMNAFPGTWGN